MTYYIANFRELTAAQVPAGMMDNEGTHELEIKAYYSKNHRPRGMKLAIYRCTKTDFGRTYDIMAGYNGIVHLVDLDRKPSAKAAAVWVALIEARLDQIADIALASKKPDWKAIKALFDTVSA